jgi:hypothetical protein
MDLYLASVSGKPHSTIILPASKSIEISEERLTASVFE